LQAGNNKVMDSPVCYQLAQLRIQTPTPQCPRLIQPDKLQATKGMTTKKGLRKCTVYARVLAMLDRESRRKRVTQLQ
jgi:hypothetical protein